MRTRAVVVVLLLLAACSGDDDDAASPTTTASSVTSTSAPPEVRYEETVELLAGDAMEGRDNQTPASVRVQDLLIDELGEFTVPLGADYRHPFDAGTNVIGLIPGTELPDEYVILGAHYDHLGTDCRTETSDDDVCNGAADNAAGVAAVLEIGRRMAAEAPPKRGVILAFWDAEEDGLLGSRAYVADPLVPLDATTAYLNWDIQGSNLLPTLADLTVIVGAETGGPALVDATRAAAASSDLEALALSLVFGQGRSDHATFAGAGVPSVFFTDATSGCYHTTQDDHSTVDLDKLGRQIDLAEVLARELATTTSVPAFAVDAPLATFEDARSILDVLDRAQPDFSRFPPDGEATITDFRSALQSIVDDGEAGFDQDDIGTLLGGSAALVQLLAEGECDRFAA